MQYDAGIDVSLEQSSVCVNARLFWLGSVLPKSLEPKPTSHSITSSAVASSSGGTVRPSAFAVLRLMASSEFDR
jgi:hypothetical protein